MNTITFHVFAGLAIMALPAVPAAAEPTAVTFGYLELADDPRYQQPRNYTGVVLRNRKRPFAGALAALRESRVVGRALGVSFALERTAANSTDELMMALRRLRNRTGSRFFIVDAPARVLADLAAATVADEVLLFNVSESADSLRAALCRRNLMHVIPSRSMLTDGMVQYLVSKGWRDVLVLRGPLADDETLAEAFQRSARKFGARVVAVKDFTLSNDPRERDRNNIALMTAAPRHDVVFLADTDGEFGRYVPYQTSLARPVVGTEGLTADAWHWTWERHGAPQLNQRFERRANRRMQGADWAAWAAVKTVVASMVRVQSTKFAAVAAYLKSDQLTFDAYKGAPASFRAWNNQLRQPILLHTHNAVVARAPLTGFLHPVDNLDTLGVDAPEKRCRF